MYKAPGHRYCPRTAANGYASAFTGLPGFTATLVFPLLATVFDYLFTMADPMGSWGLWANAMYSNPVLIQMASVTGIYGLIFLMFWFTSTAAWVWEQGLAWAKIWRGSCDSRVAPGTGGDLWERSSEFLSPSSWHGQGAPDHEF